MITTIALRQRTATQWGASYWLQTLRMIFPAAMDLAAHGISVYQIRRVPGFGSVPIGGLVLLWSCQPRIAWFDVFCLLKGLDEGKCYPKLAPTMGRKLLLLEIIATVYMGVATHFASWRGYYQVKFSDLAVPLAPGLSKIATV